MNDFTSTTAPRPVSALDVGVRATFITKTYAHLFGALVAFTLIEVALFQSGLAWRMAGAMAGTSWLLVLGAFMVVGWIGTHIAHTAESKFMQYAALAGFVLAEALVFVPLLAIAFVQAPGAISSAAVVSLGGFAGLTFIAFFTRKDFSFTRSILMWIGMGAILLVVASLLFGFEMGTWFSVGMVVFAGASILYDTSNVIHHYPEDRYVGAALELFASVALMFWYVLRIFLSRD